MSSAEPGARPARTDPVVRPSRAVRPADVEDWFRDLGLEPTRTGRPRGDHQLGPRPRRASPVRPAGHGHPRSGARVHLLGAYAPPISDMFRKSYRKLLRWNDEFPFAKFSVSEDERPLLAVELPIEAVRAPTSSASPSRGSSASPIGCSRNRRTGSGSAAGARITGDRTSANAALLDRFAARLPS